MTLELHSSTANYSEIPLVALKHSTKSVLSQSLNGTKIIPSPSNLPRDWRGLAHLAGVISPHVNSLDPTALVLSAWERHENTTVQTLIASLKEIDRWDVIEDTTHLIDKDVSDYLKSLKLQNQSQVQSVDVDNNILTIDDLQCIEACGKPKYYDAFLLFDDSDREFALTVLDKLENEFGLKLCCKDRDLIGGLPFEHDAIMQLIRDRCRRLIVIVSPLFLESPANKFFLTFAQAIGIEQRQRKIIPCVYSKFKFPPQLHYYFVLDFTRSTALWNFWERLSQSIKAATPSPRALPPSISTPEPIVEEPESASSSNAPLPIEKWECKKIPAVCVAPSAPSCESSSFSFATSSGLPNTDVGTSMNNSSASKTVSNSSTVESLNGHSESEPILPSRSLSTSSLLSKVFTSKRIKPKWLFKKKKKIPVAVES